MEFNVPDYDWMQNIEEWGEYFPCDTIISDIEGDNENDEDDLIPPKEEDTEIRMELDSIDTLLNFSIYESDSEIDNDDDEENEILSPPTVITNTTLLQNIHFFQTQSQFTYPVAILPSLSFSDSFFSIPIPESRILSTACASNASFARARTFPRDTKFRR